jgi:carboxypeptidase C (cathepsin A)
MAMRGSVRVAPAAAVLVAAAALARPMPAGVATPSSAYWARPHTVATKGEVTVDGVPIRYTADTGTLMLRDDQGRLTGEMFYVAYFKDGTDPRRPVTFLYNGGPGASSAPLLIGAFGPVRVVTAGHSNTAPAPYSLVPNSYSLLNASDLVFIDAMGTGFSRILGAGLGGVGKLKTFYSVDSDAASFAQFITGFLSKYGRWNSPKFLIGESYGTTRSAAVAYGLAQEGVDLNGIVMLSTILNFDLGVIDQPGLNPGINLPYALALPSYAAVAWYQKKLPDEPAGLRPWLAHVQAWAMGPYLAALDRGSELPPAQEERVAAQMSRYTGLAKSYLLKANLRVSGPEFEQQLLLGRGETTGRLDGRFTGPVADPLAEIPTYDPEISAIGSAYVSAINQYLRHTLHFGGEHHYLILSESVSAAWNPLHTPPGQSAPADISTNVMPDLAGAMTLDPALRVMVNAGFFDLATPYFAAVYQMRQLPMQHELQQNIEYCFYRAGHMIYVAPGALAQLQANIVGFIRSTVGSTGGKHRDDDCSHR